MKAYQPPRTAVTHVEPRHSVLGAPLVSSDGRAIHYDGPTGDFDGDDAVAVKAYNVWDDDWMSAD